MKKWSPLKNYNWRKTVKISLIVIGGVFLLTLCWHALADGTDILAGTNGDANTTLSNTGKKWLYLIGSMKNRVGNQI